MSKYQNIIDLINNEIKDEVDKSFAEYLSKHQIGGPYLENLITILSNGTRRFVDYLYESLVNSVKTNKNKLSPQDLKNTLELEVENMNSVCLTYINSEVEKVGRMTRNNNKENDEKCCEQLMENLTRNKLQFLPSKLDFIEAEYSEYLEKLNNERSMVKIARSNKRATWVACVISCLALIISIVSLFN
jgi:hypothetical protein